MFSNHHIIIDLWKIQYFNSISSPDQSIVCSAAIRACATCYDGGDIQVVSKRLVKMLFLYLQIGHLVINGPPKSYTSNFAGVSQEKKGVGPSWEKGIESVCLSLRSTCMFPQSTLPRFGPLPIPVLSLTVNKLPPLPL